MHPGLLKFIHGKLTGSIGGLLSWENWQLDQLLDIPMWRFGLLLIWLCYLIENVPKILRNFLIWVFYSRWLIILSSGDFSVLPLPRISGMPSSLMGDSGSGDGDGSALATPLDSPSPSSKLR
jgi:hypothetical protein